MIKVICLNVWDRFQRFVENCQKWPKRPYYTSAVLGDFSLTSGNGSYTYRQVRLIIKTHFQVISVCYFDFWSQI